jgi:uncharacterized Fe-S center protein
MRASYNRNILDKTEELLTAAGLPSIIKTGDIVAVKLHFGEPGNTAFIRPIFVRRVVEALKKLGAKPFLTDTTTLYVGGRANAVDHIESALHNGFNYTTVGAPIVIADGLRGASCKDIPVKGAHFDSVSIASEIANADAIVALSHFKCHELSGIGGALKNIGMGSASRRGKLAQHSNIAPKVKAKACVSCGECIDWCPNQAITLPAKAIIDKELCIGCGECIIICPQKAIQIQWTEGAQIMQEKMSEYALGAMSGKLDKSIFLNFITQVSPACDCMGHSDAPIVPDLGITCSTDPVAIDQASADLVNGAPANLASKLPEDFVEGQDKFRAITPKADWTVQLESAQKLGLGQRSYDLITL